MSLLAGGRLLRRHLRPQHHALRHLAAWSALEAVPAFFSGLIVANAVDHGFLAGRPLLGFSWLAALALLYALGTVGTRQAFPWLAATVEPLRDSLVTAVVTASVERALRDGKDADGASVSQATVQVETVRALVSGLLRSTRQMLSVSVAAIGGLAVFSPLLALVVVSFVVLALAGFALLLRVLVVRYRAIVLCGEQIGVVAAPVLEGMRDVVAYAAEDRAAREVGAAIDAEAAALRAFARASALKIPVVTVGAQLPVLALLALAPWLVTHQHLTVGQIAGGVIYLFGGLAPAIQTLMNSGGTIVVNLGVVLGRLAEISPESTESTGPTGHSPGLYPAGHDLDVDAVTFAYSPHAEPIVRDLTLHVPAGMHLAVVGPSGVGKSTLANLLARLATPQRGQLRLGGLVLEQVDESYLRCVVALIPQEAYVFAGSIRDNLVYLQPKATQAEIDHAVAAVGFAEARSRLGGDDAVVPPGGGALSPGERQLIALARVYLSSAQIVILDEATCHLDPVAEARAENAFAERHGTLIVIAHRISSAMRADRILVMDGADAVLGGHRDLLASSSLYADLVGYWDHALAPDWHAEQAFQPVARRPAERHRGPVG
ncbi:MAG: ATP-binding cassette domain-containing protein [Pseudonocardiaceae bacterium]